jgi:hypothetical protein
MTSAGGDVRPRVQQTMNYAKETGSLPCTRRAGKLERHSPRWGSCGSSGAAPAKLAMREWLRGDTLLATVWKRKCTQLLRSVCRAYNIARQLSHRIKRFWTGQEGPMGELP